MMLEFFEEKRQHGGGAVQGMLGEGLLPTQGVSMSQKL